MKELYDANLVCTLPIDFSTNTDQRLFVTSQSCKQDIVLTSNNNVVLVTNDGTELSSSVKLDCQIEVMHWSSDGEFLALADATGGIHVLSSATLDVVYNENLVTCNLLSNEEFKESQSLFCSVTFEYHKGVYTLCFSCANGKLFLQQKENFTNVKENTKPVQSQWLVIKSTSCHEEGLCCHCWYTCFYERILFTSGYGVNSIAAWYNVGDLEGTYSQSVTEYSVAVPKSLIHTATDSSDFTAFVDLKQVQSFIFALSNNGHLYQFSLPHFILVRHLPGISFTCVEIKMPKSLTTVEGRNLCKIFGVVNVNKQCRIRAYNWEDITEVFSETCERSSKLINAPTNVDEVFYVSKNQTSSFEKKDDKFGIGKLSQSSPDSRFYIFLQHHKYEDAADFALKYNLNTQPLYQHKAAYLLELLSSSTETDTISAMFSQFKECVIKIEDALFVGELCVNSSITNISIVYELLKLARDYLDSGGRLYRASVGADTPDYTDLSLEVDRLLDLLVTFRMTFGNQDACLWPHFQSTKLSTQVASLLAAGKLQAATVICSRHESNLVSDLEKGGAKQLETLLNVISDDADVNDLVAWFELIIPAILTSSIQNSVEILTEWLHRRALALEDVAKAWPDDGIKIANVFFKVQKKLSTVGFVRDQLSSSFFIFNNKEEITQLKLLASRLQSLKTLRSRYQCNITLNELVQETTVTLAFRMLDKVTAPELVSKCLDTTVRPYMNEHKLDEDETLLLYIKELIGTNKKISGQFRLLRKRKVVAIIKCLKTDKARERGGFLNVKVVVEATLLLAKEAPIPWSKDMHFLVEKAFELSKLKVENQDLFDDDEKVLFQSWSSQLAHCMQLEKIPALAAKYDIGIIPHGKLVNHERFLRRLVRDDREDALCDAETVASIFSDRPKELVYFYRLQYLIEQAKVSKCLEVLESQPALAERLVYRVFLSTKTTLEYTESMWVSNRKLHCEACIAMMEHIMHSHQNTSRDLLSNWADDFQMIKNIYYLQSRYGEFLTIANYDDKHFKHSLLSRKVMVYYVNKASAATQVSQPQVIESSSADQSSFFSQSVTYEETGSGERNTADKKLDSFSSLLDLALLLQIAGETMMAEIALKAAKQCQVGPAIDICKDLYQTQPSKNTVKILKEIALTLLSLLKSHSTVVCRYLPDICELVSIVAVFSKEEYLVDVAALSSLCHLSRDTLLGTDLCAGDFISKCVERGGEVHGDRYEDSSWLNNWYVESDVLTLQSSSILPLVSHIIQLVFNSNGVSLASIQPKPKGESQLDELVSNLLKATEHLNSNHRITLSLQWLAGIESIMMSHLSNVKSLLHVKANGDNYKKIFELMKYSYSKKVMFLEALLKKVFLTRTPDSPHCVALLLAQPVASGFRLLNSIYEANSRNFSKIKTIAQVALEFARLSGNNSEKYKFESLLLDASWAQRLHSLQISGDCFILSSNQWKKKYLFTLLEHSNITGQVLMDYCNDYDVDSDGVLIKYVGILLSDQIQCISSWGSIDSPPLEMIEGPSSSASAVVLSRTQQFGFSSGQKSSIHSTQKAQKISWEKIKEELKWVSRNVSNMLELIAQIERCLVNYMSPYDYDKADFVLQSLLIITKQIENEYLKKIQFYQKACRLLNYLRYVKREQPVSEVELQRNWRKEVRGNVSTQKLPQLAQTKLPLHPLIYGDVSMAWKVLSAEANEKTVENLIPIAKLLNFNEDKLYTMAADNAITRYKEKDDTMNLTSHQLAKLRGLTEKIKSKKMAAALSKRIAEVLPVGQEKVDAYQWCLTMISNWRDSLPEESPEREMISNAYQTLVVYHCQASCELALMKHGCNTSDALKLMMKPDSLIDYLYQHSSIVTRFYEPGDKYPDIHALVDEVAAIYQRDGVKLRLKIIIDLLLAAGKRNNESEADDSTVNLERIRSAALANGLVEKNDEADLIRLLYVLTYDNPEVQGRYLLQLISNHQDSRITNACRVRALHCLFRILDDDEKLFALTNKTAKDLRADMRVLIYLTELEEANFNVPASHLRQADKSSVAQSVIASSTRQRNPVALRAAAEMCREFGSASSNMWIVLLQQLVSLQQVAYLQQLLPDICRIPAVLALPCLASVWQSCVTLPIVSLTPPLDQQQMNTAISSYHFLVRCPVVLKIDLQTVAKYFHTLGLQSLALACLLISPSEQENAKKLAKATFDEITAQLEELHTTDRSLLGYNSIVEFLKDLKN